MKREIVCILVLLMSLLIFSGCTSTKVGRETGAEKDAEGNRMMRKKKRTPAG